MTLSEFKSTLSNSSPPPLAQLLLALWYDAKGDWDRAHGIVKVLNRTDAFLVHAYLHRKEGNHANSRYWYSRAGKEMPVRGFNEEWEALVSELLANAESRSAAV